MVEGVKTRLLERFGLLWLVYTALVGASSVPSQAEMRTHSGSRVERAMASESIYSSSLMQRQLTCIILATHSTTTDPPFRDALAPPRSTEGGVNHVGLDVRPDDGPRM
jgi:hypothetical protein